jgi:hypothetical protein
MNFATVLLEFPSGFSAPLLRLLCAPDAAGAIKGLVRPTTDRNTSRQHKSKICPASRKIVSIFGKKLHQRCHQVLSMEPGNVFLVFQEIK